MSLSLLLSLLLFMLPFFGNSKFLIALNIGAYLPFYALPPNAAARAPPGAIGTPRKAHGNAVLILGPTTPRLIPCLALPHGQFIIIMVP
jgi:hypothetical protein